MMISSSLITTPDLVMIRHWTYRICQISLEVLEIFSQGEQKGDKRNNSFTPFVWGDTHFFYKNHVYKNIEAEISQKIRKI